MEITHVDKDQYQINLSKRELQVMSLIAVHVGGESWARDIFSNPDDSLLSQICKYIKPVYYAEELNLDLDGSIYIEPKLRRDKRGRFCKKD
mgnify:CR=1 FL=1